MGTPSDAPALGIVAGCLFLFCRDLRIKEMRDIWMCELEREEAGLDRIIVLPWETKVWCTDKMQHCEAGKTHVPSVIPHVNVSLIYPVDLVCRFIRAGTVSFHVGVFSPGGPRSFLRRLCSIEDQILLQLREIMDFIKHPALRGCSLFSNFHSSQSCFLSSCCLVEVEKQRLTWM